MQHKLELEREEKAQALRAQAHAAEIEKLRCSANLRREAELRQQREQQEFERYKLELLKDGKIGPSFSNVGDHGAGGYPYFDVSTCLRLVPKFSEKDPDTFFLLFERLARNRKWSDSEQTLLLQCVSTGRAQEAFSALTTAHSENYLKVKLAALKMYELVPEAYQQKFRSTQRHFDQLCELVLLAEFRETLPVNLATHLSERNAKTLTEAAVLADEYALTHKVQGETGCRGGRGSHQRSLSGDSPSFSSPNNGNKWDASQTCYYCLGKGHWKADCPVLRSCAHFSHQPVKPAALAALVRLTGSGLREKAEAIAAVQQHTNPVAVAPRLASEAPSSTPEKSSGTTSEFRNELDESEEIDPGYRKHVSDRFVSLVGSEEKVPVKILRDSGALDSFILDSVTIFISHCHWKLCAG